MESAIKMTQKTRFCLVLILIKALISLKYEMIKYSIVIISFFYQFQIAKFAQINISH